MIKFMVLHNLRKIKLYLSHLSFYSIIIFNSSSINCGNFFDVNNEPLDLSLKNQNSLTNSMQFTNDFSDSEILKRNESEMQNTNSQFDDPNLINYRSMNSRQGAQLSSNEAFSKYTDIICTSVKNKTGLNIYSTENVIKSSNLNPNNPEILDKKETTRNQNKKTDTYKNKEILVKKDFTTSITTNTESFNLTSASKISKKQNKQVDLSDKNRKKSKKLASSSISKAKNKEKNSESKILPKIHNDTNNKIKKWKTFYINKFLEKSNKNTINCEKNNSDELTLVSKPIQKNFNKNLRIRGKNTSINVSFINKNLSENRYLSNYESSCNTFDNLNKIISSENNLQKYFRCYDYNYRFYEIRYKKSEIIDNVKNTQFDLKIENNKNLYKVTKNLIKLIKKEYILKEHIDILDKSLVEQQKIKSDLKNINLKKIKSIFSLIDRIRQFKNKKNTKSIRSYQNFIRFYTCFVEPLSCLNNNKNTNYKYLEILNQKFADSYIFLKNMGNKKWKSLKESKKIDLFYLKNVHKGPLDDLAVFEKKINSIFENKNLSKKELTVALQKIFEDEKFKSRQCVTRLENFCSKIIKKYYILNFLKSRIIVLCFILIKYILNQDKKLDCEISEIIINYIYMYSIQCKIQCFKHFIISKANLDILYNFDSFNEYLTEFKVNQKSKSEYLNSKEKEKMIILNKKRLIILKYFFNFYLELFLFTNDISFQNLTKLIGEQIDNFISNYSKKYN